MCVQPLVHLVGLIQLDCFEGHCLLWNLEWALIHVLLKTQLLQLKCSAMEPVHSGHPWDQHVWPLQTGGWFNQVILSRISITVTFSSDHNRLS